MLYKTFLAFLVLFTVSSVLSETVDKNGVTHYDGHTVLRLTPRTFDQLKYLHDLAVTTTTLDFWTYPSAINSTVDVNVSPQLRSAFNADIKARNIEQSVMISDVEQLIVQQKAEVSNVPTNFTEANEVFPNYFTAYRRLADVFTFLAGIVSANPAIASIENIGQSTNNQNLRLIKIGIAGASNKPIYFIDSAIHAREWVTASTTAYFVQYLIDGYRNNNAAIRSLLTFYDFYILPVANPDGYEFTHTNTRLWRKTRSSNSGSTCIGTDPNRNWAFQWNPSNGGSTNPCSDVYSGASAANQPETKALQDYLYAYRSRIRIYIAVHSYSQLLLWAWGYTSSNSPSHSVLQTRGNAAVAALTAVYNTRYTTGTITNVLYAASGNAVDYAYQTCGITYSYTIELRDTGTFGFQLPVSQINPTGAETAAFFVKLGQDLA